MCVEKYQVPCREGHTRCYNVSEICKYNLNEFGHLVPCRTGEHLGNCSMLECGVMFKCQNSYCIPWQYLCDGRWDCSEGLDESVLHFCGHNRNCASLFKCKQSEICIHFARVCDEIEDCPHYDDEYLCILQEELCPRDCECLTYGAFCRNITLTELQHNAFRYSEAVFCLQGVLAASLNLSICAKLILAKLIFIGANLCDVWGPQSVLQMISVPSNNITTLNFNCFKTVPDSTFIDVHDNLLSLLPEGIFVSLLCLKTLNVSGNPLREIEQNAFGNLPELKILSFLDTQLHDTYDAVFSDLRLKTLETNNVLICCLAPQEAVCSIPVPWYESCGDIFGETGMKITCVTISLLILILNHVSLVLQRISFKPSLNKEKTGAFGAIAASLNITDCLCAPPLLLIWTYDHVFSGFFTQKSNRWRSSLPCFLIFEFFLLFALMSPQVLCLLSYARLSVVQHPMDSKFKETRHVCKQATGIFLVYLFLSSILTILTWVIDVKIVKSDLPVPLCSPFVDFSKKMILVKILTCLLVLSQIEAEIFICVVSVKMFLSLKASQQRIGDSVSRKQSKTKILVQVMAFNISIALCWLSTSTVFLLSMFLKQYPVSMVSWATTVTHPITALVNPLILIVTSARKLGKQSTCFCTHSNI